MIYTEHLRFSYPNSKEQTLKGINFTIDNGTVFGFLGPSGAGKSTIQKILIGILKGYEGRVQVMGREARNAGPDFYESIGVAFEFPNFYGRLTALENLSFFRSLYRSETEDPQKLLRMVGLEDAANRRVSDYSKGMKMRLNLCRALLNRPKLLFLDEPTSGLDPVNACLVKDLIRKEQEKGHTVLITTHNMTAAEEICDRVAFIVDGEVKLIDSPRNLMLREGTRKVRVEYREGDILASLDFELEQLGNDPAFLDLIRHKSIETMHSQEASLEDIFIRTTGRGLR
jgi:fluoroquinolone transport system ATP-binding protein